LVESNYLLGLAKTVYTNWLQTNLLSRFPPLQRPICKLHPVKGSIAGQ